MTTPNKIPIAVVLPDGREHFDQMQWPPDFASYPEQKCQDALRALKVETPRNDPQSVKCKLFHLTYKNGQPYRQLLREYDVMPPLARMTEEEFQEEMKQLLTNIPEAFHGFVEYQSYEQGHSCGREEVVLIASDIVSNLKPSIDAFAEGTKNGMVALSQ